MITTTVEEKVKNFFEKEIKTKNLKLYNEAGLQYELALYLRHELEGATILLEYPVTSEFTAELNSDYEKKTKFVKKEIDLFIEHEDERVVIELKFPRSTTGFPGVIYNAAKDVKFGDQIVKSGRANRFITTFITDHKSVGNKNTNHIYNLFNSDTPSIRTIKIDNNYPKFMKDYPPIDLNKDKFEIDWKALSHNDKNFKYYIISSDSKQTSCK